MTTLDFVIDLFVRVDDAMKDVQKHSQAKLYPSELVTLGLIYALKGGGERAFWRWADRDLRSFFPGLPERTRLFRLLATHQDWADRFLADPTLLGVIDSYGIELLHPVREDEKTQHPRIATKGKSNHRWILGAKFCFLLNQFGLIVCWDTAREKDHDTIFHPMIAQFDEQTLVMSDMGFHAKEGDPSNLKVCKRGTWNDRMLVETTLSMLTHVCHLKKLAHRTWQHFEARLAFVSAAYNLLVQWNGLKIDPDHRVRLSMAEFAL